MKELFLNFFRKKHFWPRLAVVVAAVILMGFSISWLLLVDFGADPCTLLNVAVSDTIGISLGSWQALFNLILFVIVIFFGGKNLGLGTVANMLLVGYSIDFFSFLWERILPRGLFSSIGVRVAVLIPALALFILAAAVYIDVDMGTSPFDALPIIISEHLPKIPFRLVRIAYDGAVTAIGMIFGGMPGVVTVVMVLALGPVISWVGEKINKRFDFK